MTTSNDINEGISYILEKLGETVETMTLTTFYEDYEKYPTFLLKISIIYSSFSYDKISSKSVDCT